MFITPLGFILASPSFVWRNNQSRGSELLGPARTDDCSPYWPASIRLTDRRGSSPDPAQVQPGRRLGRTGLSGVTRGAWNWSASSTCAGCVTPLLTLSLPFNVCFSTLLAEGERKGGGLRDTHQENNNKPGSFVAAKSAHDGAFFHFFILKERTWVKKVYGLSAY